MESGNPPGDTGERERLEPPSLPKDVILKTDEDIGTNLGAAARFDANLLAIRTLKDIESEGRRATPAEQAILARYSGFGDSQFEPAFTYRYGREGEIWERRGKELQALTTEEEYRAIASSRLNAFFTTPQIIKSMWAGLGRLGISNINQPHILEPSAGSGRFFGYQPVELASRSQRTAVELDQLTGKMLKYLYPQSEVYVSGFEFAPLPKDSYDIAISNVPFGNYPIFDRSFKKGRIKLTKQIHNYFFAKTLERLRPSGVLAFITTHGTLDAPTHNDVRKMLADEADLLGAIRLPKGAFPDTEVCTDIIFMRKRAPGDLPGDRTWIETQEVTLSGKWQLEKVHVNRYFIEHPEMVLGEPSAKGTMHGGRGGAEYTVEPREGEDLVDSLARAIGKLPEGIIKDMPPLPPRSIYVESAINERENARVVDEQGVVRIKHGGALVKGDFNAAEESRIKGMLKVRDSARAVLSTQLSNGAEEELAEGQKKLNQTYDDFVTEYGALRKRDNASLMKGDPDEPFLLALEKAGPRKPKREAPADPTKRAQWEKSVKAWNEWQDLLKSKTLTAENKNTFKMPIFSGRTIHGLGRAKIENENDALAYCYNELGRVDLDRMAELLGKTADEIEATLADRGLIYKNPVGDWEISDEYLSGDVRDKLRAAELAASANPHYKPNVTALKRVQPVDLKPSEVGVSLGAPWIPASDVNQFVGEICKVYGRYGDDARYFTYTPQTGDWTPVEKIQGSTAAMKADWGTQRMSAPSIIEHILNGRLVEVTDPVTDEVTGKEKRVRNTKETIAAQEKAKAIQNRFAEWIWEDEERSQRLLKYYNETFNNMRARRFDGSHLELPGMTESWHKKIHRHQKDAIWRVVQDRTALLAHEVGFGKTAVMVASGMEARRLGLSRKNLYVVPKPTRGQFKDQFTDIYPYANILFPSDDDFTKEKRPEFVSRIATGDWDGVILTYDQFESIPIRPETEARFIQDQIDTFAAALYGVQGQPDSDDRYYRRSRGKSSQEKEKDKTQKEIEKAIKKLTVKLQETMAKIGDVADNTIYFDDLGIDQLYVDEADNFKNLQFATNMGRLKGLPNTDSQRAWNMYAKTKLLHEQGKGHGVVFATGTPVANTIAEMYTMMRYLQGDMLEAKGLQHFDAWAKTFGKTKETLETTAAGTYRVTQRFAEFNNAPELSQLWQQVADIRVADEVPEMVRMRPRIVDRNGKSKRTVIAIEADAALKAYMKQIVERADTMGSKDKSEDNMLKLSSDARKAALDVRMVNPSAPGNPQGKVAVAAGNIARIYQETEADKGTQLVFLDIGIPKAKDKVEERDIPKLEEDEETEEELQVLRNVYGVIRDTLIANGIPKDKIAFIHDAKTDPQKKQLYEDVNSGNIRVVIGSTAKLGTGVNVQERAAALHHLDAPWRPRDIEQREGRVVRQGNKVYGPQFDNGNIIDPGKGVGIYTYVTKQSFDEFMWQAIEKKAKAIKSIMRRDNPPRTIEDIDDFTLSASEAKALASGNPDVMKAITLKNSISRLQMLHSSYVDSKVRAKEQLTELPKTIQQITAFLGPLEKEAKQAQAEGDFALTVHGTRYDKRPEAAEVLRQAIANIAPIASREWDKATKVGSYKGFDIKVLTIGAAGGYDISIWNPDTNNMYLMESIPYGELTTGILTRIENKITKYIPNSFENRKRELDQAKRDLVGYEKQASATFDYQEQLDGMEKELARLEKKLQGEKVEDTPSDNYVPVPEEEMMPGYHFAAKEPEIMPAPSVETNPDAAFQAVRQEIEPVEGTLEVKEPTKAQMAATERAVETMAQPKPIEAILPEDTEINVDDTVIWHSPHTNEDVLMNFRGWNRDKAILYNPQSGWQGSVPRVEIRQQPWEPEFIEYRAEAPLAEDLGKEPMAMVGFEPIVATEPKAAKVRKPRTSTLSPAAIEKQQAKKLAEKEKARLAKEKAITKRMAQREKEGARKEKAKAKSLIAREKEAARKAKAKAIVARDKERAKVAIAKAQVIAAKEKAKAMVARAEATLAKAKLASARVSLGSVQIERVDTSSAERRHLRPRYKESTPHIPSVESTR